MNNEMTTDNMSNEEVIEVLKGIVFNGFDRTTRKERQALHLAIKSLKERPQGDLISREALKEELELSKYIVPNDLNKLLNSEINRCIEAVDNAPTVEPQNEWGKWIVTEVWCPKCHEYCDPATYPTEELNKCPNCGSAMRKGGEE